MGNTPSVVELTSGEHTVAIRKSGCKAWERKIKLTSGDIKLNAELEKAEESPKAEGEHPIEQPIEQEHK